MAKLQPDYISWTLSLNAGGLQKEIHNIKQNSKELKEENKDLKKSMQELILQGKYQGTEYNKLNAQYKENNRLVSENTAKIRQCESQLSNVNKSYSQLSRQAKQLQRDLDNTVQSLEPEEYARLEKELLATKDAMAKLKGKTDEVQESMSSLTKMDSIIIGFFAGIGNKIMSYLDNVIQRTKDYVTEGNEMAKTGDGIKRAFDRLDRPGLLDNLRKSTKNTVTDLELMKNAVQAEQFRIPLQDLGKYLQFAQMRAQDAGESVEYMTKSIVTGLGRKSVMILDNLGLSAAQINEEVAKTGDFMQGVANIVDRELAKAGENYVSVADRSIQKTVKLQNEQRKLGEILLPIMEKWETLSGKIEVGTVKLIAWLVKHKNTVVTLTAAIVSYIATKKLATMWESKYGAATLLSVAAEKIQAIQIALSRKALLAKLIVLDLYRGRCNLATAATEMFNLVLGANKLALFTTLLITAATALMVFKNNNNLATKTVDELNKRLVAEKINLNNIFEELKKTNPGTAERSELIDTLNEKYPGLISNYSLEKASLQEITQAQNDANDALTRRIAAEMKAESLQKIMTKNATTQVNATKNIIKAFKDTLEPGIFEGVEKELQDFLSDSSKSIEDLETEFNHLFTRPFSGQNSRIVRASFKMLRDNQKSLSEDVETVNKAYEPFLKTLQTAGRLSDDELKKQVLASSILRKLEQEKQKVQDTWKEDTKENITLKNREIERLDEEIKKYRELGKVKGKDYQSEVEKELTTLDNKHAEEVLKIKERKEKEELTEAQYNQLILQEDERYYRERLAMLEELEKKTSAAKKKTRDDIQKKTTEANTKLLEIERKMDENEIALLQEQRDKRLEVQEATYEVTKAALVKQYADGKINKRSYDASIVLLDEQNSKNRLVVLQDYQEDVKALELNFGKIHAVAVKKANEEVINGEIINAQNRIKAREQMEALLSGFKQDYNLQTLPEETDMQLKTLEASYQAKLELAKQYGEDTTELTKAYEAAQINITKDAEMKKAQVLEKYGLLSWKRRMELQLQTLREERDQGLINAEDYAKAELLIKMNSWKEAFDYYSNLFGEAFTALQNAEIANMEAKYDVEIEAAKGNAEEVERLEQEKAEKKLEIEKKYADVQFAVKASQIIANTATAIMTALAQLGPIAGPIAAALMGVTGAAQLAAANAERQKVKNMTLNNTGGSSSGSAERVVNGTGYSEGGFTGNGGRYEVAGVVHRGEYVVPMPEMKDKRVINAVKVIESVRRQRTGANPLPGYDEGYYDGGYVDKRPSGSQAPGAERDLKEASEKLLQASENLNKPAKTYVVLSEINAAQDLKNKLDDPFTRGDKNGTNN